MKNRDFEAAGAALADEHAARLTLCSGSRYCLSVLGGSVTYCTVVEFEWGAGLDRERFAGMMPAPTRVFGFEVSSYVVS